ncbi:MAG: hypothetical protein ACXVB2_25215 [Isosphaeraceae bacterium]
MKEPVFQIEEINDPVEVARCTAQDERGRRNSDWLQAHWADLLPQARGKFVAVSRPGSLHRRHGRGGLGLGRQGPSRR